MSGLGVSGGGVPGTSAVGQKVEDFLIWAGFFQGNAFVGKDDGLVPFRGQLPLAREKGESFGREIFQDGFELREVRVAQGVGQDSSRFRDDQQDFGRGCPIQIIL